jgi:hypothetical protein
MGERLHGRRVFLGACGAALVTPLSACGEGGATADGGVRLDAGRGGGDAGTVAPGPVEAAFDPARTRVFAVGILGWADMEAFGSFTTEGRRDVTLLDALVARGVPRGNITHLQDRAATRAAVREGFAAAVAATRPGELLWFYYAGHGMRVSTGRDAGMTGATSTYLVPYDGTLDAQATCWGLPEIAATLGRDFRGAAVLLTADCCYSGALSAEVMDRLTVPAAVLASSDASEQSTGAWTFTDCLLDGVRGAAAADRNGDGRVTLADVASHAEGRLAYLDQQRSTVATRGGFASGWYLGPRVSPPVMGEGETVEARSEGRWYRAIVLERRSNGQALVRYAGYNHLSDEWVGPDRVRPYTPVVYPVGQRVEARWRRRWYAATVAEVRATLHKIHYTGWSDSYDEWVGSDKLRMPA